MGPDAAKKFEEISAIDLKKRTPEQRDFYDNALKNVDDNPVKKLVGNAVDKTISRFKTPAPAVINKNGEAPPEAAVTTNDSPASEVPPAIKAAAIGDLLEK
jgi:hypothetical protein